MEMDEHSETRQEFFRKFLSSKRLLPITDLQTIDEKIVVCVTPFTDFFVLHNLIRFGDVVKVSEFIWKHPSSLLKPEGIPSVMVDNIDYNALQAAASLNFPLICQLILDICGKPEFYRLVFPGRSSSFISKVRDIFYKQYLNSGSQSTGDTPLHFASKFGFIDCCKIFLSNPQSVITHINHDAFTPEEIICTCVNEQNNVLKEDIQALFTDGMMYIPVFRSENKLSSFVGSPITCNNLHSIQFDAEYNKVANYSLAAFAGPMCLKMAQMFHKGLKDPSSLKHFKLTQLQKNIISRINFSDPVKGIERIGRRLADFLNIEWKEYFPVFNLFTNFYNKEGLMILEDCLKKRKIGSHYFGAFFPRTMSLKDQIVTVIQQYPPHVNPLNHVVNQLLAISYKPVQVYVFEGGKRIIPLSSLPEFPTPPQSLDAVATPEFSSSTIFLNGSSYSNLDTEVFIAIKELDIPSTVYPEICKWRSSMAAYLRMKYNIIHLQSAFKYVYGEKNF